MLFDQRRPRKPSLLAAFAFIAVIAAAVPGCSGGNGEPAGSAEAEPERSKADRPSDRPPESDAAAGTGRSSRASNNLVRTDADGRQWIEDIPLDVWHDDPLETYGSNSQIAAAEPVRPPTIGEQPVTPTPGDSAAPSAEPPGPGESPAPAGTDWSELIAAPVLDAEAKSLRNQLTSALQTVATYNNNLQAIQWDGATLCAVAGIGIEHPEALSWKDKAPQIRDLAQKIEEAAQERGRDSFEATQVPFEQMISVFSGNVPAGLEPSEPSVPFAESASRGGLMRRMQESFDWLSKNINSADRLTDAGNKDQLILETSILAALTKVVSLDGYASAEEPDYAQEAQALLQDALDARSAAQAGSYDAFREAVDRMETRCNTCHGTYRFE